MVESDCPMMTQEQQLFLELFPVDMTAFPHLTAYRLVMKDGESGKMGGKLAFRLRQMFPGCWVWADGRIITDTQPNPVKLLMAVDTMIKENKAVYGKLTGIEEDYQWELTPQTAADFVLRGPMDGLLDTMREALSKTD